MCKKLIYTLLLITVSLYSSELSSYLMLDKNTTLQTVEKMVKAGENPNGDSSDMGMFSGTPLYWAAGYNKIEIVKYLLEAGANINGKGYGSALNVACYLGNYEIAKLLLEKGADPYRRNKFGRGVDSFCLGEDKPKITQLLNKYKIPGRLTSTELKAEMEILKNKPYALKVDFKYYKTISGAMKKAKKVNKPILLVIGKNDCQYCLILKRTTLSDKRVLAKLQKDFVVLVLDANKKIPHKYYTPGVPAMWFLTPDGNPMFQALVGAVDVDTFYSNLGTVTTTYNKK